MALGVVVLDDDYEAILHTTPFRAWRFPAFGVCIVASIFGLAFTWVDDEGKLAGYIFLDEMVG
jgi:hypothetical protein